MVYGMDPDIVDGFNTPVEVKEALLAIPTLSIATELDNLFGQSNGIYVNAKNDAGEFINPLSIDYDQRAGKTVRCSRGDH